VGAGGEKLGRGAELNRKHRILIAGAGGVVGAAAVEHFASLPDWQFTDRAFAHGIDNCADSVLSGLKLRQHGFADCFDTEDAIHFWLERMQQQRLLPR